MSASKQPRQITCPVCSNRVGYAGGCDCLQCCQTRTIDLVAHIVQTHSASMESEIVSVRGGAAVLVDVCEERGFVLTAAILRVACTPLGSGLGAAAAALRSLTGAPVIVACQPRKSLASGLTQPLKIDVIASEHGSGRGGKDPGL